MSKLGLILLVAIAIASPVLTAEGAVFQAGGDRLVALQNTDGGWDWPLDDGNVASVSPRNTIGPIAMGLAKAYAVTNDPDHLASLTKAGDLLLGKTNNFSPSDGYLAVELDKVFGGTTYSSYVTTNFYDKLASGTYNRNGAGTLYDTASYVQLIRNGRTGSQANMAAWDVGTGLYAAKAIGASTSEWITGTQAEVNELNGGTTATTQLPAATATGWYDVIGLAGAVMGLASANADFDPNSGEHIAASNLQDLGDTLAGYQISTGGFAWNKNWVIPNDSDESVQETAYAILALNELNPTRYASQIALATGYLESVQLASGGWEGYPGGGENNELTGEALWASSVPEPATMSLLALGGLAMLRRRK